MATEKRVPANTTIDPALRKRLDDLRWAKRYDKFSDLVADALKEFADKYDVQEGDAEKAPDAPATAAAPAKGAAPKA